MHKLTSFPTFELESDW